MGERAAGEIVHNADSRDHFEVLGLPRLLTVDEALLTEHYYKLSRLYHPDFHQNAPPSERMASLRRTAAVNDAYKALRDPYERGKWWLEFVGGRMDQNMSVPQDLVAIVFDVQDDLSEFGDEHGAVREATVRSRQREVSELLARRVRELDDEFARWDLLPREASRTGLVDDLQRVLAGISYLKTLLRDIDTALENVNTR